MKKILPVLALFLLAPAGPCPGEEEPDEQTTNNQGEGAECTDVSKGCEDPCDDCKNESEMRHEACGSLVEPVDVVEVSAECAPTDADIDEVMLVKVRTKVHMPNPSDITFQVETLVHSDTGAIQREVGVVNSQGASLNGTYDPGAAFYVDLGGDGYIASEFSRAQLEKLDGNASAVSVVIYGFHPDGTWHDSTEEFPILPGTLSSCVPGN